MTYTDRALAYMATDSWPPLPPPTLPSSTVALATLALLLGGLL
ncbi:hypothetical protein [Roseomonas sp. BN140053]